jgi:predicted secreted protein
MPISRRRKKEQQYVPPKVANAPALPTESPRWLAPTMVAAFLAGLIWIVIFYVSSTRYPIPDIGAWNMVVGFGFIAFGFGLATKWR